MESRFQPSATPVPGPARPLGRVVNPIYRCFDRLYRSKYNPLYRSGTLAVGFLFVLLVTGCYLSIFYSVSDPYESVVRIQSQTWFGRWIRALHRYATVAVIIAVGFHVLQLLIQGKSWGPRTLAWISGILLTSMLLISTWSGYAMVWDSHGQLVTMSGARMLQIVPVLQEVLIRAFNGTAPLPAGFFFMNLFLHVALPLMMIIFLWLHTSRLSRSVWLPAKPILISSIVALVGLSIVVPAPLLPSADLLQIVGRIPIDIVSGVWIPMLDSVGPFITWIAILVTLLLLLLVPWWWRPRLSEQRAKSEVNLERCTGCSQCVLDCPYEAIRMAPREDGRRLIAEVNPDYCVSCGICAASCADYAIGPPGRAAVDQRERILAWQAELIAKNRKLDLVMVACTNNQRLCDLLSQFGQDRSGTELYSVECCGCVHSDVIEKLLESSEKLALIGCPARNCYNRDGLDLLTERVFEKRVPFVDRQIDRGRILVSAYSEAEAHEVIPALARFSATAPLSDTGGVWQQRLTAMISSIVLLCGVAALSQYSVGTDANFSIVRLAGLLPSSASERCRAAEERDFIGVPLHMRSKQICERVSLSYSIQLVVDGNQVVSEQLGGSNAPIDRPLFLNLEHRIAQGEHDIKVSIAPTERENSLPALTCSVRSNLPVGQIKLIQYDRERGVINCEGS